MHQVQNFELYAHFREIRRPSDHPHVVDVAPGLPYNLGDLGKSSRLIEGNDADAGRKALRGLGIDVPGDVDPALVLELFQPGRVYLEDADALPGDEHADDAVAGDRAARLEGDGEVVLDAADGEPGAFRLLIGAEFKAHHPVDVEPAVLPAGAAKTARAAVGGLGVRGLALDGVGNGRAHDVLDLELIAADGGERVLERLAP